MLADGPAPARPPACGDRQAYFLQLLAANSRDFSLNHSRFCCDPSKAPPSSSPAHPPPWRRTPPS
jgi:hypothetical protein